MVLAELQNPPSSTTKTSVSTVGVWTKSSCTDPLKLTPTIVVDGSMVALADKTAWYTDFCTKDDAVSPNEAVDLGTESAEGNSADPMVMEPVWEDAEDAEDADVAPCISSVRTSSVAMVPIIFRVGVRDANNTCGR